MTRAALFVLSLALPGFAVAQDPQTVATGIQGLAAARVTADGRFVALHSRNDAFSGVITVTDRSGPTIDVYLNTDLRPAGFPDISTLSSLIGISDDGRYLSYVMTVESLNVQAFVRFDRTTRVREVLFHSRVSFYRGPGASVSRDGQVFGWVDATGDVSRRRVGEAAVVIGRTCVLDQGTLSDPVRCGGTTMNADGSRMAFVAPVLPEPPGTVHHGTLPWTIETVIGVYDAATGTKTYYPEASFGNTGTEPFVMSSDGGVIAFARRFNPETWTESMGVLDVATRRVEYFSGQVTSVTHAGNFLAVDGVVYDRVAGRRYDAPGGYQVMALTPDGRFALTGSLARTGDDRTDVAVWDLDADQDGMFDLWESAFGLSPATNADAATDADGDGVSNAQEFVARSHPTAAPSSTRMFAEGAAGSFFDTVVSVFNPGDQSVETVVRFLGADGKNASRQLRLAPKGRVDWASCCIPTLTSTEFGITVESTGPVVADRTMSWDRVTGYGAHAASAAAGPSPVWFFAEGATIAGFQTFYLLSNPGQTDVSAAFTFLLSTGATEQRNYMVPAGGRLTVWANQEGAPLNAAEFSAAIVASGPIVAERALYRGGPSGAFTAGSDSMGVTEMSSTWHFAEGSTGPMFDTFLLVANPGLTAGTVTARYGLPDGTVVLKEYAIAAQSRLTIWVDQEDALLADTAFSTTLTSSVPTVAERAMWWPGDGSTWTEVHTEAGATAPAQTWATAGGHVSTSADTFFLVLNTSETDSTTLTVTVHGGIARSRQVVVPASSRTTLWMRDLFPELNGTFSTVISSSGAPIVVERAVYTNDFEAGTALRATPLP